MNYEKSYEGYLKTLFEIRNDVHMLSYLEYINTFNKWSEDYLAICNEYRRILLKIGVPIFSQSTCEVNKFLVDSVVSVNCSTVSPFVNNMRFRVMKSRPYSVNISNTEIVNKLDSTMYLTYNPINELEVSDWDKLPNYIIADICIGFCGRFNDVDFDKNNELLLRLHSKIPSSILNLNTVGDKYFSTLVSDYKNLNKK